MKTALTLLALLQAGTAQEPAATSLQWRFAKGERFRFEWLRTVVVKIDAELTLTETGTGLAFEVVDVAEDGSADLRVVYDRTTAVLASDAATITYDSVRDAKPPKNANIQNAAGLLGHPFRLRLSPAGRVLKVMGFDAATKAAQAAVDPEFRLPEDDPDAVNEGGREILQNMFPLLPPRPVRLSDVWKGERGMSFPPPFEVGNREVAATLVSLPDNGKTALLLETHRAQVKMPAGPGKIDYTSRLAARWDVVAGRLLQTLAATGLSGVFRGSTVQVGMHDDIRRVEAADRATYRGVWERIGRLKGDVNGRVADELSRDGTAAWLALRVATVDSVPDSEERLLAMSLLAKDPGDRYADRFGLRRRRVAERGGSAVTEGAVHEGLRWLGRHQGAGGGWNEAALACECAVRDCSEEPVAQTGLALLAFYGAGYSWLSRDREDGVRVGARIALAVDSLVKRQDAAGAYHPTHIEAHAIATMAVVDSPAGLEDLDWSAVSAHRAVQALRRLRTPGKGWAKEVGGEPSARPTCWGLLALWRAREAGIPVPAGEIEEAATWLETTVLAPSTTAALILAAGRAGKLAGEAEKLLTERPNLSSTTPERDLSAALVMLHAKPEAFKDWQERHVLPRVAGVMEEGTCVKGSWSPTQQGRVSMTAQRVLLLETYYRYPVAEAGGRK